MKVPVEYSFKLAINNIFPSISGLFKYDEKKYPPI